MTTDGANSSVANNDFGAQTYEAIHANMKSSSLPDKVAWDSSLSFRQQPYRHLHHQNGIIGHVQVRLMEARNLKRVGWSVLGLGPVKLLGLSKAVGEVSSFGLFWLSFDKDVENTPFKVNNIASEGSNLSTSGGKILEEVKHQTNDFGPNNSKQEESRSKQMNYLGKNGNKEIFKSDIVPSNNNPIWTPNSKASFSLPVRKRVSNAYVNSNSHSDIKSNFPEDESNQFLHIQDGMRIRLHVKMEEDRTTAEAMLPIGMGGTGDGASLGEGSIDLTRFILGLDDRNHNYPNCDVSVEKSTGVMNACIELHHHAQNDANVAVLSISEAVKEQQHASTSQRNDQNKTKEENYLDSSTSSPPSTVRICISYIPNGLEPQINDICSLESFARCPLSRSSCPPIFPPLQPMKILDIKHPFVLVQYRINLSSSLPYYMEGNSMNDSMANVRTGTMKFHRNALFVVERHTMTDHAVNLILSPADIALSHPLGKQTSQIIQPYVEAASEVAAPVIMSSKLMVGLFKTSAGAGVAGLSTAAKVMVHTASNSIEKKKYDTRRQQT